ncbi:hypothetical protein [Nocardia mexicana]|uniref:hypothetical protein n=1 Tax=Nocardia mexicana TaxID=279262 RepID=UPI001471176D|nr:hypothetical protein [Nocardia mexicana]
MAIGGEGFVLLVDESCLAEQVVHIRHRGRISDAELIHHQLEYGSGEFDGVRELFSGLRWR